jgi:hypothetical protein
VSRAMRTVVESSTKAVVGRIWARSGPRRNGLPPVAAGFRLADRSRVGGELARELTLQREALAAQVEVRLAS